MPSCLGASGFVRARSIAWSANWATVVQIFWPVIRQPPSTRSARVLSEARSDPAPGSLNSWHHTTSPRSVGTASARFCSSVPCATIASVAQPPMSSCGMAMPAAAISWAMTICSSGPAPRP